jgi:hypothetical protein
MARMGRGKRMSAAEPEVVQPELAPDTPAKKKRGQPLPGTLVEVAAKDRVVEIEPHREGVDINTLMVHAVQTGNIDTMERVMAIRRELKAEAAKEAFFAALSAFQAECPIIKKTKAVKDGNTLLYHYAPLDKIVEMVGPLLTQHGLSYKIVTEIVRMDGGDDLFSATCEVYHETGHSESSEFRVPIGPGTRIMSKPQIVAAAGTFAKRYSFCNALGILTGDEDTDARYIPNEVRAARQPVSQPRQTPTAQRAEAQKANGGSARVDLEPAGEGEAIDANTIKGLTLAMEHAKLGDAEFKARFPQLSGLEQVKKSDSRVVMSWVADPSKN